MRRLVLPLVALLLLAGSASAQPPAYRIEVTDARKVSATISYEIRMTTFAVEKWMIFLPEPPELPSQRDVKVTALPAGKLVAEKSGLGRTVRYLELRVANPTPGRGVAMQFDVEATLRSRKLVPLKPGEKPPQVATLTAAERKYYLAPTPSVDFDTRAFQDWLTTKKLQRERGEHPVDFAARILEVIRADYTYAFDPDEDKRASVACKTKRTDCGGMSYLFVGAMRANDIPARLLVGREALPRKPGSTPAQTEYDRPHVRAEFYVNGTGWVPVDPSHANSSRRRPVSAFIGNDSADLLVLHVDVDLRLPFPDKVRDAQFLQIGPYYWTTGRGTFDGSFGPTGWELKATSIRQR
jgi:transglutaminase-like putative cysteine protease